MPGLYIHIPYCVRKCLYCDFYSVATSDRPLSGRITHALATDHSEFLDALEIELSQLPATFAPETIFIGGGTPTELSDVDFERLLTMVRTQVDIRRVEEWTCESNPGTLTRSKADMFRPAGINRVSLGVQSFQAENLEFLGRIHSGEEAVAGYQLLRDAGIGNINLDLIFAIPGSDRGRLEEDLEMIIRLNPEHTSCYCLMFEPGTPLTKLRDDGFVREADDQEAAEQYQLVRERYLRDGYHQYEISNFSRRGYECRHNLLYWGAGEYIGCGPSAHSHWSGHRYGNVANTRVYCKALLRGQSPRDFDELLDPESKARETLVMGLRRLNGVRHDHFLRETGFDYRNLGSPQLQKLTDLGLLEDNGTELKLTQKALFISDAVFADLI